MAEAGSGDLLERLRLHFLYLNWSGMFPYLVYNKQLASTRFSVLPVIVILTGTIAASGYFILTPRFDDESSGTIGYFLSIGIIISFAPYILFIHVLMLRRASAVKNCFERLLVICSAHNPKRILLEFNYCFILQLFVAFLLVILMNFSYIFIRTFLLDLPLIDHTNITVFNLSICRIVETAAVNVVVSLLCLSKNAVKHMKKDVLRMKLIRGNENFQTLRKIFRRYQEINEIMKEVNGLFSLILLLITISCILNSVTASYYNAMFFIHPKGTVYDTVHFVAFVPLAFCYIFFDFYLCFVCNFACREVTFRWGLDVVVDDVFLD